MRDSDWEILTVLFEKKSINKAAAALYMTQSALTKRVKSMETEWDVELIRRSSQGVTFTEEGRYLVNRAMVMLDILQEIREHFQESKESREQLRLGVPSSFARLHMPGLFRRYDETYGRLQIRTVVDSSDILLRHLMDGAIDMGILCGDFPWLGEKTCLFTEDLYAVTPNGMTLEDIGTMPLIKSHLNPIVKLLVEQWWKNHFGSASHEAYAVPDANIAIEMVEHNLGVTFVFGKDWKMNAEIVQMIPIYDQNNEPVSRKVWMALSNAVFQSQDKMDFVSLVEEYYKIP